MIFLTLKLGTNTTKLVSSEGSISNNEIQSTYLTVIVVNISSGDELPLYSFIGARKLGILPKESVTGSVPSKYSEA